MMNRLFLIVSTLFLIASLSLVAQEAEEQPEFVTELTQLLEREGWSGDEVAELATRARELDWESAKNADPQAVALALELTRSEDDELEGPEQARLALELAAQSTEMRELGFDDMSVARTALRATQRTLSQIQEWKESGQEGNLGQMIRNQVSDAVRSQARIAAAEHSRGNAGKRGRGVGRNRPDFPGARGSGAETPSSASPGRPQDR
jgi:hypothetical protein